MTEKPFCTVPRKHPFFLQITFCRNHDRFKYINIMDIDEVVVPVKFPSLPEYLRFAREKHGDFGSIGFVSNVFVTAHKEKQMQLNTR